MECISIPISAIPSITGILHFWNHAQIEIKIGCSTSFSDIFEIIEGNETNNMIHILVLFDRNRLLEMNIDFILNIQMIIWIIINAKQLYPNHLSRSRITKLMLKSQQGKVKCLKNKNQELVFLPFLCYRYVVKISWSCFSFLSFVCLSVGICVHFIIAWNET